MRRIVPVDLGDFDDGQVAVGVHAIAAAVARVITGREVGEVYDSHMWARTQQALHHKIPLDVDVCVDPVRDLEGEQ